MAVRRLPRIIVLVAAVVAAGLGTGGAAGRQSAHVKHNPFSLTVTRSGTTTTIPLGPGPVIVPRHRPTAVQRAHAVAVADATRLLAGFPLLSGVTRASGDESTGHQLDEVGGDVPGIGESADLHRFFIVPTSTATAVISALEKRPPTGYHDVGQGGSGSASGGPSESFVTFLRDHNPAPILGAGVTISAAAAAHGAVAVRVDALVVVPYPRPARERIPADADVAAITAARLNGSHRRLLATVTQPAVVGRLRRYLDRLPVIPPGVAFGCVAILPTETFVTIRFARAATASPLVSVAENGCSGLTFTAAGRTGLLLYDPGSLRTWLSTHGVRL